MSPWASSATSSRQKAVARPRSPRHKVHIIEGDGDMVTSASFNVLLKVVEESAEHLKFVSRPTISSRTTNPVVVIGSSPPEGR
jgi:hypothetical protein